MIVDTSALVAIVLGEAEALGFVRAIEAAKSPTISAAIYLETGIVVDARRDAALSRDLDALIGAGDLTIAAVTPTQARIAREAYRDFGRGSGHPAGLNFGDCFSYALAKETNLPLLFKGDDFRHTDIEAAA